MIGGGEPLPTSPFSWVGRLVRKKRKGFVLPPGPVDYDAAESLLDDLRDTLARIDPEGSQS